MRTIADLLVEHVKECSSDHCTACDCGWSSEDFDSGILAHADHVADVVLDAINSGLVALSQPKANQYASGGVLRTYKPCDSCAFIQTPDGKCICREVTQ